MSGTDNSETLYTLVDGLTGDVAGWVTLAPLPTLTALLELYEMSVAEFVRSLRAEEIEEVVMLRPEVEMMSSSLLDEGVLEDTKKALRRSLKSPMILTNFW